MLRTLLISIAMLAGTLSTGIAAAGNADIVGKKLAVMPFRISLDGYALADHGNARSFSQRLNDKLVSQLALEKGVVVVNRDFFAETGLEKAVVGADASPEELSRLGKTAGADVLLVGRVQEARTETEAGGYDGQPKKIDKIRLSWRLIEAATGKLLDAGELACDNPRKPKKWFSRRDNFEKGALFTVLAGKIVDAALGRTPLQLAPTEPPANPTPAELTPGSADKPIKW